MRQRVVLPAIPKTLHDIEIFVRDLVTNVVRRMFGLAVVAGAAFKP
jgi:hypothetical protein